MIGKGINPRPGEWDPVTYPFRCTFVHQTSAPGCYGWRTSSLVYRTEADALEALGQLFGAGVRKAYVDRAEFRRVGSKIFRWVKVAERKRNQPTHFARTR